MRIPEALTILIQQLDDVTEETIQEMGEDLGNLLGQVIKAKIAIESIIFNLESFS